MSFRIEAPTHTVGAATVSGDKGGIVCEQRLSRRANCGQGTEYSSSHWSRARAPRTGVATGVDSRNIGLGPRDPASMGGCALGVRDGDRCSDYQLPMRP